MHLPQRAAALVLAGLVSLGAAPTFALAQQDLTAPPGMTDCGPPSTTIPGPPPQLISVGQLMDRNWLLCYVWQDTEQQDFTPEKFGNVQDVVFAGYPVECNNPEVDPGAAGTPGLVVPIYVHDGAGQYVLFTYRIQDDGDYINNCDHQFLDQ